MKAVPFSASPRHVKPDTQHPGPRSGLCLGGGRCFCSASGSVASCDHISLRPVASTGRCFRYVELPVVKGTS